jgi:hypothetical protein
MTYYASLCSLVYALRQEVSLLGVGCDELFTAEIRRARSFKKLPSPREFSNDLDLYQQTLKIAAKTPPLFEGGVRIRSRSNAVCPLVPGFLRRSSTPPRINT